MFLRKFHLRVLQSGFPRVCGDVSVRADLTYQQGLLSPRMRGCFLSCNSDARRFPAFPAYAGMFPVVRLSRTRSESFPRVCGDVSITPSQPESNDPLSPRMRGCFLLEIARMELPEAFPAYAGMFLYLTPLHKPNLSFPRVCGDVSDAISGQITLRRLSPRMRGCFLDQAQNRQA